MSPARDDFPFAERIDEVVIELESVRLRAFFGVPRQPRGAVIFAHGSGSGRLSPRNNRVAATLREAGLVTVLADLLSSAEADDRRCVFDIPLLAERVRGVAEWTASQPLSGALPLGYFGASTGAAAALAASVGDRRVHAVVSRGGRPDLAPSALPRVSAPTLLIVGSLDEQVLELNRRAFDAMKCHKRLEIVHGATHLFEEPGTLERVTELARDWFVDHLTRAVTPVRGD